MSHTVTVSEISHNVAFVKLKFWRTKMWQTCIHFPRPAAVWIIKATTELRRLHAAFDDGSAAILIYAQKFFWERLTSPDVLLL